MRKVMFILAALAIVAFATSDVSDVVSTTSAPANPTAKVKMKAPWWEGNDTLIWAAIGPTPEAVSRCSGAYDGGKYYQLCGNTAGATGPSYDFAQIWDGSAWSAGTTAHPGGGVHNHSSAVCGSDIVVGPGSTDSGNYSFTSIYVEGTSWTQDTASSGEDIYYGMAATDTKCYKIGGNNYSANCYEWTPGDATMTAIAGLPVGMRNPACAAYDGKIYAFGGSSSYPTGLNTIYEFDTVAGTWATKTATLTTARLWARAVTINNLIYVIGGLGSSGSDYLDSVEVYDPVADSIVDGPVILYSSRSHAAGGGMLPTANHEYAGEIFVSGGWNGSFPSDANQGAVTGITYEGIQPTSLGNIKAAYK